MKRREFLIGTCLAPVVFSVPAAFAQEKKKLSVLTSLPKELSAAYKQGFEKLYPDVVVEVQQRGTQAAVTFLRETKANNTSDIMWASAPDAFEVLKKDNLLEKFSPKESGVPAKIGDYPINDPEGYYAGFALSGGAIMWNSRYLKAKKLPVPKTWDDLTKPELFDQTGIAMPSRSGSTHLTLETILQARGWNGGWALVKAMCGNMRQITERSFGVPDAVSSGQFGYGIVFDYQALAAHGSGFPVEFAYPPDTTIVPSNIGVVKNGPNKEMAQKFIEYMLSEEGQALLFNPKIGRLPVLPTAYKKAPEGVPNPFEIKWGPGGGFKFDVLKSETRYAVVDSMFDQTITFQLDALKAATKAIHDADAKLSKKSNATAADLLKQAREAIAASPFDENQAVSKEYIEAFAGASGKKGAPKGARQSELEQQWSTFARDHYAKALELAKKADQAIG